MANALEVAKFFLATNPAGSITNLKLQKLCSYAQAIAIAYLDQKLFSEDLEMWELGPVVPVVYRAYKDNESRPIAQCDVNLDNFTMEERYILVTVNDEYAERYDALELCLKSHDEFPGKRGSNEILTFEQLRKSFSHNPVVEKMVRADNIIITDQDIKDAIPYDGYINSVAS